MYTKEKETPHQTLKRHKTTTLSIDDINKEVANNWHWLNSKQKRDLKALLIDTWNNAARFSGISKSKIVVKEDKRDIPDKKKK